VYLEGGQLYRDNGRVFAREDGSDLSPEAVTKTFRRLTTATSLRTVRLNDLRHVAASLMISSGADIAVVSKRLGHSTISVTSDLYGTYSHPPAMRIPMLPKPSVRPIPPCRRDQCAHTAPGRLRWRRDEQGPHTAFPLVRGLSSVSTERARRDSNPQPSDP